MNLHHIKSDNDNGTKYLEIAFNNAIKAVENCVANKVILYNIPLSILYKYKLDGAYTSDKNTIRIATDTLDMLYDKLSCECVITSLAKSVKL